MKLRRRAPGPRWQRLLTWVVVGIVVAVVAAELVARAVVDAGFIERQLRARLPARFGVRVGTATFSLLRGSLDLRDVVLGRGVGEGGPGPWVALPDLRFRGLDRLALLRGGPWRMDEVVADSPRARIRLHALVRSVREGGRTVSPEQRLERLLPPLRVGGVRVAGGTLVVTRDDGSTIDSLVGLDVRLRGLSTRGTNGGPGSAAGPVPGRVLLSRAVTVRLPSFRHVTSDGLHALRLDSLVLSTRDSTLRVAGAAWAPTAGHAAFVSRGGGSDFVEVTARGLEAHHVDFARLVSDHALLAGHVRADSLEADVFVDRGASPAPDSTAPRMPNAWLDAVRVPLALDTIVVGGGTVTYAESPAGGGPTGRIRFTDVDARLLDLANRAGAGDAVRQTTTLELDARAEGLARVRATVAADLRTDSLDVHVGGALGSIPASAFDSASVPLAGVRAVGGVIDSIGFDFSLRGSRASGRVLALYHGLRLARAEAGGGQPGLFGRIGTAILNRRVWAANPSRPGKDPRIGTVDHQRKPGESFYSYIWRALRGGLLDAVRR